MQDATTGTAAGPARFSPVLGAVALAFAIVAAASVTMIGVTSFTSFNPPDWVGVATMAPLPFALLISIVCALADVAQPSRRAWSIVALAVDAASIAAFAVMMGIGG